jgi:hypothetical protein
MSCNRSQPLPHAQQYTIPAFNAFEANAEIEAAGVARESAVINKRNRLVGSFNEFGHDKSATSTTLSCLSLITNEDYH